jgi:hypothetical protein
MHYIRNRTVRLLATASLVGLAGGAAASAPAPAPSAEEKAIADSLEGDRLQPANETAPSAATAGYFRVLVAPAKFGHDQLCPRDTRERSALEKAASSLWSYTLKKKRERGAALRLAYGGAQADFDNPAYVPSAAYKFYLVTRNKDLAGECDPTRVNMSKYYSPLIPLDAGVIPQSVGIEFSVWSSTEADRQRLGAMQTGIAGALGLAGLPIGLLTTPAVQDKISTEIKDAFDRKRLAVRQTTLYVQDGPQRVTGYVGLRAPKAPFANEAQVSVSIVPVASMFATDKQAFADLNLAAIRDDQILATSLGDGRTLESAIIAAGDGVNLVNKMEAAVSDETASSQCDTLAATLRNRLKMSETDAAITLWAIASRRAGTPQRKAKLRSIECIDRRAALLKANAKITVPDLAPDVEVGPPVTRARMDDLMEAFGGMAKSDAPGQGLLWGSTAFPLPVYDLGGLFGWSPQRRNFTFDDRDALRQALRGAQVTNVACWARFPAAGATFAPGLDGAISTGARKSAALIRRADGQVFVAQFRYNSDPAGARIDGIAFLKDDPEAFAQMVENRDCGQDWMKPVLPARN